MNTLFLASGYRIAMKICKVCVLKSCGTVKKFDNFIKTSRKLRDFEIGPSDDYFCQYIYLKNSISRLYLEVLRENSAQKLYSVH